MSNPNICRLQSVGLDFKKVGTRRPISVFIARALRTSAFESVHLHSLGCTQKSFGDQALVRLSRMWIENLLRLRSPFFPFCSSANWDCKFHCYYEPLHLPSFITVILEVQKSLTICFNSDEWYSFHIQWNGMAAQCWPNNIAWKLVTGVFSKLGKESLYLAKVTLF